MRRSRTEPNSGPHKLSFNPRSNAETQRNLERMLTDFWEVHQRVINKIEKCESPSPEELAEATLNQCLLAERLQRKREESARAAKQLLDAIDLEP